jgi:Cdc6-like AAA superfamily ATPase
VASEDDVAELRRLTAIPDVTEPYSDAFMGALIDTNGIEGAAALVWREKAAAYAEAVDMSESGSTRKFSDLHKNALAMAGEFGSLTVQSSASGVVQIERP